MKEKYLLSDIKIEGIKPTQEWREIAQRQKDNNLRPDDMKKILNPGYKIKEK